MPSYKLTLAYDGTGFVGWQRQASGTSIQQLVEDSLKALAGRDVVATAAGRTDAGVHALGQVVAVSLEREWDTATVVRAVNARLPPAVRVLEAQRVDPAFHARFDARSKTYRYRIVNAEVCSPFERAYAWHVPGPPLNIGEMSAAATLFEGRHDFSAFQSSDAEVSSAERVVFSSRVTAGREAIPAHAPRAAGTLIDYEVTGDGFLRHMVRAIAGSLVEVGRGRFPPAWIGDVLASRDRTRAGRTAPAEGLFLVGVSYE